MKKTQDRRNLIPPYVDSSGRRASAAVTPYQFVNALRTRFPMFAQTAGNPPAYMQQDAEECLREMFSVIGSELEW